MNASKAKLKEHLKGLNERQMAALVADKELELRTSTAELIGFGSKRKSYGVMVQGAKNYKGRPIKQIKDEIAIIKTVLADGGRS
jgi:hypothetical protein